MTAATFERGAFEERLDQIESLLADLWAVDAALEAIPKPSGTSGLALGGVKVRLGRTHPFEERILAPGVDPTAWLDHVQNAEATRAFVARLEDEGSAWAAQVVGGLRCAVQDVVRPIPSEFADAEAEVRSQLSSPLQVLVDNDFGMLSSHLSDWEGRAAEQFADYFYNRVQGAADSQTFVSEALCRGLAASKAIVHLGQHSLMGLVEAAHQVLDDQLRQRQAAHTSTGWSTADWMLLVSTLALLGAAIPTGGASLTGAQALGAMAAGTGTLLQFSATQIDQGGGEDVSVDARSAEQVAEQLGQHAREIRERMDKLWGETELALTRVRAVADTAVERGRLWPERPNLADGVAPDDYYHESLGTR